MRDHAVDVPDPDQYGRILLDSRPEGYNDAEKACRSLKVSAPADVQKLMQPKLTDSQKAAARDYARCMQRSGAPDFPDPNDQGLFDESAPWDETSAGAAKATKACSSILGDDQGGAGVG